METPRPQIHYPAPPTPRMDTPAAVEDERRPRPRPRAREVSSRYMLASPSPVVASTSSHAIASSGPSCVAEPRTNSGAPLPPPLSKKPPTGPQFRQKQHAPPFQSRRSPSPSYLEGRRPPVASSPEVSDSESDKGFFLDENRFQSARLSRSSDTPLPSVSGQAKLVGIEKKRAVLRLFGENREDRQQHGKVADDGGHARGAEGRPPSRKARHGTPVVSYQDRAAAAAVTATPRLDPGCRAGLTRRGAATIPTGRSAPPSGIGASAPLRLTDENVGENLSTDTSSSENSSVADADLSEFETGSFGTQEGWCESPKIRGAQRTISRSRGTTECRSSMSDADRISGKFQGDLASSCREEPGDGVGGAPSLCHRSLNSALSSAAIQSQLSAFRAASQHQYKAALEAKKGGRKASASRQEDIHALRMAQNQYLMWRFVNAKSQNVEKARSSTAEKSFYALSKKLSQLRDSVVAKRTELERMKNLRRLSSILDAQMPYLEQWGILEDEFSHSLTGANEALRDASTRIPLIENAKADIHELTDVFGLALKLTDAMSPHVESFLSHIEDIDRAACDLAKITITERSLITECGGLLSEVQQLQVVECSLRSQLIQLQYKASSAPNKIDQLQE